MAEQQRTARAAPTRARASAKPSIVACKSCKIHKWKCSGTAPCDRCKVRNLECQIDPSADQRRKSNRKRKIGDMESDQALLLDLIKAIRRAENKYVMELVNLIRGGTELEEVREYLDDKIRRSQLERTPELIEVYGEVRRLEKESQRKSLLDVKRLTDIPIFSVPAKPWTTVTDDDNFVSHLISLWFTWDWLFSSPVDADLFLKDMESGNLDSEFCSPFLVNAILAQACFYSDYPETYAVVGSDSIKGQHFWNEAKRILDAEEGHVSFTTAQGTVVMFVCACTMGKDRLGWGYAMQATDQIHTLRSTQTRLSSKSSLSAGDFAKAMDRLELGSFIVISTSALALHKSNGILRPKGLRLPEHESRNDQWSPYPKYGESLPAHTTCNINQQAKISEVAWEAVTLFCSDEKIPRADLEETVLGWYDRLLEWAKCLPECMNVEKTSLPSVVTLHMYYHAVIVTIWARLKEAPRDAQSSSVERSKRAREICLSSSHKIAELASIQKSRWGFEDMSGNTIQWVCVAMFILMEDFENPGSQSDFLILAKAATSFAKRWPLQKGMFRLVQLSTQRTVKEIPSDIGRFFKDFESKYWKPEDVQKFSSRYPNFGAIIRQQDDYIPDDMELDKFLEKWDSLTLDGGK